MKRVFACFSFFVFTAFTTSPIFAGTINDGNLDDNLTSQAWFSDLTDFPLPPCVELPCCIGAVDNPVNIPTSIVDNLSGLQLAQTGPDWKLEWTNGGGGTQDSSEVGSMIFEILNSPESNPSKEIAWLLVSDKTSKLSNEGFFVGVEAIASPLFP